MSELTLKDRISEQSWIFKSLLIVSFAAVVFSSAPAVFFQKDIQLPPAYELKSQKPFADTSKLTIPPHDGERSHGAKLTPRLLGSVSLWLSSKL
ncbi:MAG: hypothetical protein HRT89_19735, partial [Lentisphaeria bacterium]|nr:hypothetical protein [Lentisphaeria bacterium]NQZ70289.1 hypothetical protein [Lentisphaeria bacterium]